MDVVRLGRTDLDAVEAFFRRHTWHAATWDRLLDSAAVARLARAQVASDAEQGGVVLGAAGGRELEGVAVLTPSAWDTAFFGVARGQVTVFEGSSAEAEAALAARLGPEARRLGLEHVHAVVDGRCHGAIAILQRTGWRVAWTSLKMVCDTQAIESAALVREPAGAFEVIPFEQAHLDRVLDMAERVRGISWLEHEPDLPAQRRREYLVEMTRNCCAGRFADLSVTLLDRGAPVGFNASAISRYPEGVASHLFTHERVTFTDPTVHGRGYGHALERGVVRHLAPRVRFLTGRVRLGAPNMLRVVEDAGFRCQGGDVYLVRRTPA